MQLKGPVAMLAHYVATSDDEDNCNKLRFCLTAIKSELNVPSVDSGHQHLKSSSRCQPPAQTVSTKKNVYKYVF